MIEIQVRNRPILIAQNHNTTIDAKSQQKLSKIPHDNLVCCVIATHSWPRFMAFTAAISRAELKTDLLVSIGLTERRFQSQSRTSTGSAVNRKTQRPNANALPWLRLCPARCPPMLAASGTCRDCPRADPLRGRAELFFCPARCVPAVPVPEAGEPVRCRISAETSLVN